jgi:hypothetical protein
VDHIISNWLENNVNFKIYHEYFEELITPLLDNKIYRAIIAEIENDSLRKKLIDVDVTIILFPIFFEINFSGF